MEWPLIFFTVLSQMATGSFITLSFLNWRKVQCVNKENLFLSISILILTGISMIAATMHLGRPLFAYRAILNFETSWLSREIIIFSVLMGINFLYSLALYKKMESIASKLLHLGAIISFIAVIVTSMIYVLPSYLPWDNFSTPLFFILTEIILGPLFIALLLKIRQNQFPLEIFNFVFVIISLNFLSYLVYVTVLSDGMPSMIMTYQNIIHSPFTYLRLVFEVIIPLAYWFICYVKRISYSYKSIYPLFILIFLGEFLGRMIFYSTVIPILLFGN